MGCCCCFPYKTVLLCFLKVLDVLISEETKFRADFVVQSLFSHNKIYFYAKIYKTVIEIKNSSGPYFMIPKMAIAVKNIHQFCDRGKIPQRGKIGMVFGMVASLLLQSWS